MKKKTGLDSDILSAKPNERVQEVGTQCLESIGSGFSQTLNQPEEKRKTWADLAPTSIVIRRVLNEGELEEKGDWHQTEEISNLFPRQFTSWNSATDEVSLLSCPIFFSEPANKAPLDQGLDPSFSPECFQKTVATTNNTERARIKECEYRQTSNQIDFSYFNQCCGELSQYSATLEEKQIEDDSFLRLIQEVADLSPEELSFSNNEVNLFSYLNSPSEQEKLTPFSKETSCHNAFPLACFQNAVPTTNNSGEVQTAPCLEHKLLVKKSEKTLGEIRRQKKAARYKQYYDNNKKQIAARYKQYYAERKIEICAAQKQYYHQYRDAIIERRKILRNKNKEKRSESRRKQRLENKSLVNSLPSKNQRKSSITCFVNPALTGKGEVPGEY